MEIPFWELKYQKAESCPHKNAYAITDDRSVYYCPDCGSKIGDDWEIIEAGNAEIPY